MADPVIAHHPLEVVAGPQYRQVDGAVGVSHRVFVKKAHGRRAELRALEQAPGDEMSDAAGANDQGRAGERPPAPQQNECEADPQVSRAQHAGREGPQQQDLVARERGTAEHGSAGADSHDSDRRRSEALAQLLGPRTRPDGAVSAASRRAAEVRRAGTPRARRERRVSRRAARRPLPRPASPRR